MSLPTSSRNPPSRDAPTSARLRRRPSRAASTRPSPAVSRGRARSALAVALESCSPHTQYRLPRLNPASQGLQAYIRPQDHGTAVPPQAGNSRLRRSARHPRLRLHVGAGPPNRLELAAAVRQRRRRPPLRQAVAASLPSALPDPHHGLLERDAHRSAR
ncbi:hypothetical protein K505DRAFT_33938, partial [Melanomma pulvis-pyrius CBS 109.77]